ncbi:cytochrome b [Aureimonas sp. AU20]|uniref:cytochrome b n=1 Tax=Aureimonas sp. AU20 TaxID=1349819 RepID=UPI000721604B|nr:cytochrome b [Aureimonas sp. AU20]ALN71771.1 hypothetical protein M673_03540 [Aureimonas sp. AU20]
MPTHSPWVDDPEGYGRVSRILHWGMALLLVWQLLSAVVRAVAEHSPLDAFFWSTHVGTGFTIAWLAILRGAWGLANLRRRPATEGPALLRKAAALGHIALYGLLILVPALGILRAFGKGRDLTIYGHQVFAPVTPGPNAALGSFAGEVHEFLGWTLFALIAGHIAMALWHGFVRRDGTFGSMTRGPAARHLAARV